MSFNSQFVLFQDVLVNKDFEEIFKQVKEQLPNIKMKHGGMEPPQKPKAKIHPMVKLMNYIEKNNLKLIDFFSQLDKDGSMCISYEEFEQGLEVNIICIKCDKRCTNKNVNLQGKFIKPDKTKQS